MNYLQKELYDRIKSDNSIFNFIQDTALDGLWYGDLEKPENEWMNDKFWITLGYDPKKMPHKASAWQDIINADDLNISLDNFHKHCEDPNHPYDQIMRYTHKNGSTVWIRCRGMAIRDEKGKPLRMLGTHTDITGLKKNEILLEESSRLSSIGSWELDLVHQKLYWSAVTKEIHEVDEDYMPQLDKGINFYKEGQSRDTILQVVEEAIVTGKEYEEELQIITAKGNELWVMAKGKTEFQNGKCIRLFGTFQDINKRKKSEIELIESNKRNKIFVSQAPNALAMFDTDMKYLAASEQWSKEYGLEDKEIIGKSHYEIFPEIGDSWKKIHQDCLKGAINKNDDAYFKRQDGSEQWLTWDVRPWYITEKEIGGILMYTSDITARKKIEQQLKVSEAQFRGAFEYSAIGMSLVSPEGKWLRVNKKLCDMLGYSAQELLSMAFQDITHPDDISADVEYKKQLLAGEINSYTLEKRYYHKNDSIVWVLLMVSLVVDTNGDPMHFVTQIEDITKRKKAEKGLVEATDRLILATEGSGIGIWDYDIVNNKLVWDERMLHIYGLSAANFMGVYDAWKDRLHKEDMQRGDQEIKMAIKGEKEFNTEFRIVLTDGSVRHIRAMAKVLRAEDGRALRMIGTNWDITPQKRNEEALRKLATLESKSKEMEQFAYITSHDLREPLLTIKHYINHFQTEYKDQLDEDGNYFIKAVIGASNRMDELISGLLDYSRLSKPKKLKKVDCGEMVTTVLEDLDAQIEKTNAKITVGKMPTMRAYPLELKMLFQNLVNNAIKFCRPGIKPLVKINSEKIMGGWKFTITDNGIGIDMKDKEQIFTIFHRAHKRDDYEGTGIGLAHVKKVCEIHNGNIWVESELGKGSIFYFTILTEII